MPLQCAYIGLGAMGYPMAGHIANHLQTLKYPSLLVHNRTLGRAESLASSVPSRVARSIAECAIADVVFTCLLNDAIVEQTVTSLLEAGLKKGAIIVEQSTVAPALVDSLAAKARASGVFYLACPIMGPPQRAQSADLVVLMAGPKAQQAIVKPLLIPAIGKKAIELGEDPAESIRLKLCGNFLVTSSCEMLAEALTLGEAAGIPQDKVGELVGSVFSSPLLNIYTTRMVQKTYNDQVHFSLTGAKKDGTHIHNMGIASGIKLPITEAFLNNVKSAHDKRGDIDITGIVGAVREGAGLDFDLKKD
ncbi:hypothetical protein J3Q64DRAFT_1293261 [Phycomyces blakesleeanus]|uniref:6-phosphogluconate dehydrogenase NADP-binding domain-containing protein n=2 Tax=Phycomyces blakesleeanus TaxID=4837 RepID=A0A162UBD8_PHYB8|nr:hypothetical protein PHYBLDRAFT_124225 [Phycomyces blakesleeanus NRRL 1555(-)]OAD74982.1 hypothetical protein PHYBLDRAFT_124225 [Phycomyces blakesleeanus NRRL 1555(-)]|eukprot:XP_018293022.1 hypothetical protein PHYBLDRAFT_124225 [Phycomyces blakesleeanus NRRL 1555(-)]